MKEKLINVSVAVAGVSMFPLVFIASLLAAYNHPMWLPVGALAFISFVWFLGKVK